MINIMNSNALVYHFDNYYDISALNIILHTLEYEIESTVYICNKRIALLFQHKAMDICHTGQNIVIYSQHYH